MRALERRELLLGQRRREAHFASPTGLHETPCGLTTWLIDGSLHVRRNRAMNPLLLHDGLGTEGTACGSAQRGQRARTGRTSVMLRRVEGDDALRCLVGGDLDTVSF